jgi:hypothetical protein
VDDVAAGEVEGAGLVEEAVGGPLRVRDEAVDEEVPEEDEDEHGGELHALCGRAAARQSRPGGSKGGTVCVVLCYRPANEPQTMAAVMIAKVIWYVMNTVSGIFGASG